MERRFFAVAFSAVTRVGIILDGRFPKRSECQMFCRLGAVKVKINKINQISLVRVSVERGIELWN